MKKVMIIGATSAIAAECARLWASGGADLFLVARDEAKLLALASDLAVRGAARVRTWRMDALDTAAHRPMLDEAISALGQLDVVLIAHGTLPDQAACQRDPALAIREFSTNATSVIALLTLIANAMEARGSGAIGVITSVAGERGRASNYLYGSAKAALIAYCEGLRARLFAKGVSVTDVRPGFVASPMTQGLALPPLLVSQPSAVAQRIVKAITNGSEVVYAPFYWRFIMLIIRAIPRKLFKRLGKL